MMRSTMTQNGPMHGKMNTSINTSVNWRNCLAWFNF